MSDNYSADAELTWDDAADIGAAWSGCGVLDNLKSSTESNSNEERPEGVSSSGGLSSEVKALDRPGVRRTSSSSVLSESNTYSIHPGSSTPTCKSPVPPLPSFTQSPIVPEEIGDHKSVGTSAYNDSSSKTGMKARGRKTDTSSSTDWGSWKTSGMTRSEVEYQNRKSAASSCIPTEASSIVEVCVTSRANILNENLPPPNVATSGREKRLGNGRYNKLQEELEEVRRLDSKMRVAMKRLHNGVEYERSRSTKGSSSSGASTMCEVVQEYEKYLEMYPSKDQELAGTEVLEEHIQTHLIKIKHQIRLVEKYNRALLEKESKRSRSGGRMPRKSSKTNEIRNPSRSPRDYDQYESTEGKQSMPSFKTRIPIPSSRSRGTSYDHDRYTATTSSNNLTKNGIGVNPKHIKLRTRVLHPPTPVAEGEGGGLRYPAVDSRLPATVEYERWTWPNERQGMTTKSSHEAPVGRMKSDHEKVVDKSRGKHYNDEDKRHSSRDQDHNGGLTDDERSQQSSGVTEKYCDEMNRTFTKSKPSTTATARKVHEEERGRKFSRGIHADEQETRDKSSGRKTRNPWTLTSNNSKPRERVIPTAEESKYETYGDAEIPVPVPLARAKKSVAFYVPLFCDNCEEPVENSKKGNCYNCQKKFKWFCESKGEDGFYDAKGPLGIQECFMDAQCSEKLQKRSEDLLSSRFERMSDDAKLYLGMLAKQFNGQEATAFLRSKCHFEGDELLERVCKYLEIYRSHKDQNYGAMKELKKKKNLVITEHEMKDRTARLRGENAILMEKRRREEEQCRRAANRLLQNTYALKVRKCLKVGGGRNIGIPAEANIFKYR